MTWAIVGVVLIMLLLVVKFVSGRIARNAAAALDEDDRGSF